ncbi:ferritin [Nocardia farcinica]|uniref:ferritin n=1 Tax=Nocardia farcinica TaxID=37329 RepID=UPI00245665A2|nr:ferritin-like domain-containing protein [Nocardia farcinica]
MSGSEVAEAFPALLNAQIRRGFTVAQQYLAGAVYFDVHRLPRLAGHCYLRHEHHRGHALRMVQYLLDRDLPVRVGGLDGVQSDFDSEREAVALLLAAERAYTDEVTALTAAARDSADYLGEQFMQWFLREQLDAVAGMTTLLSVLERRGGNLFDVEEFVARELKPGKGADPTAPKMAGAGHI